MSDRKVTSESAPAAPAFTMSSVTGKLVLAMVRDKDYATAIRLLVMSGRDDDAARLAASLIEHAPDTLTPRSAR